MSANNKEITVTDCGRKRLIDGLQKHSLSVPNVEDLQQIGRGQEALNCVLVDYNLA
jgi:hypothetical protein